MIYEIAMIIAMLGVVIVDGLLLFAVRKLTKQMYSMNNKLESTISIIENKLHLIVDKINFDIPKIMEQARLMLSLFKSPSNEVKKC